MRVYTLAFTQTVRGILAVAATSPGEAQAHALKLLADDKIGIDDDLLTDVIQDGDVYLTEVTADELQFAEPQESEMPLSEIEI